jgi:dTDP-4-dehydrorhamnose reductase
MTIASQAFILGASSTIGRVLLARTSVRYGNVIGTFKHDRVPGCIGFDIEADSLLDPRFGLQSGAHVFLLAAATNPNWIYQHHEESERRFVAPLSRLAGEVVRAGAHIVFFSSELVFDGTRGGYRESDAPSPKTVYGHQKARLEKLVTALDEAALVVRTGALVTDQATDNCVVRKTYETLARPGARFAHDAQLSLTHVNDLVDITLRLLSRAASGIHHVAGPALTRTALAREVARSSRFGQSLRFEEVAFDQIPYPEPRPRLSWLASERLEREETALLREAGQIIPPKVRQLDLGVGQRLCPTITLGCSQA